MWKFFMMTWPIVFDHYRTGDRDSVYDCDFSIEKKNDKLLFVSEVTETNGYGSGCNIHTFRTELFLKGDFFEEYSKEEFLFVLRIITNGKFNIPKRMKFNPKGMTTVWEDADRLEQLKKKPYFIDYSYSRARK